MYSLLAKLLRPRIVRILGRIQSRRFQSFLWDVIDHSKRCNELWQAQSAGMKLDKRVDANGLCLILSYRVDMAGVRSLAGKYVSGFDYGWNGTPPSPSCGAVWMAGYRAGCLCWQYDEVMKHREEWDYTSREAQRLLSIENEGEPKCS